MDFPPLYRQPNPTFACYKDSVKKAPEDARLFYATGRRKDKGHLVISPTSNPPGWAGIIGCFGHRALVTGAETNEGIRQGFGGLGGIRIFEGEIQHENRKYSVGVPNL